MNPLPYDAASAIADAAAHLFSVRRTRKNTTTDSGTRTILRQSAVDALRYLWREGDGSQRGLVAARVRIWMDRHGSNAGRMQWEKIYEREKQRLESKL